MYQTSLVLNPKSKISDFLILFEKLIEEKICLLMKMKEVNETIDLLDNQLYRLTYHCKQ